MIKETCLCYIAMHCRGDIWDATSDIEFEVSQDGCKEQSSDVYLATHSASKRNSNFPYPVSVKYTSYMPVFRLSTDD